MGTIVVGSFDVAFRIAKSYGACKLNRLHSNWIVTPIKSRFTEKLRRKAEKK